MKARLVACALLGVGLTQAVSPASAQEPVLPAVSPAEATAPSAPEAAAVEPQPGPVADAAPAEEAELTAAELAAMGLSTAGEGQSASAVDTSLKLSGFADVGMISPALPKSSPWNGGPQLNNRNTSLFVGNFNLYLSKNLTESIRMFGEVRFLFLPNGSPDSSSPAGKLVNASAADYTDFNRQVQWGGINI
ncbi:MAG: hypothetical protein RLZZ450_5473 [Pseudomonadota bacterium]|jgi:hypothetical protein